MATALNEAPHAQSLPSVSSAGVIEDGRYLPAPTSKGGQSWVRTSVLIQASADECYKLWRNLSGTPRWQELMKEVRETGPKTSHWVMEINGKTTEWDSEILIDEPGHRISWRSVGGDFQNAGEVIFEPAPGGRGTMVTILQEFGFGKVAVALATLLSRNPKQAVIENLRHFKALIESGEIPPPRGNLMGREDPVASLKPHCTASTLRPQVIIAETADSKPSGRPQQRSHQARSPAHRVKK